MSQHQGQQVLPMRQSSEQMRAKKAWELIMTVSADALEDYAKRAQAIGPDILANGLLQTLAVYSSGKDQEKTLVKHIEQWLHSPECGFAWGDLSQPQIIERLSKCDSSIYRAAEVEALAFVVWLKRLAKVR